MKLPFDLDRPLVFFDLETTGLDLKNDRIVEMALIKMTPHGDVLERVRRFDPEMPIPPEATAVHGISDADVASEEPFCRRARGLARILEGCDLSGFNIRRFDLPLLIVEFRRCGVPFSLEGRRVIDVQNIFHREEPRDLSAAARFYLGREHEEAHTALGDIRTSAAVLGAQLDRYESLPRDLDGLHAYCEAYAPVWTELDRWFGPAEEGRRFRRGKHQGRTLDDVALNEPDYLLWMLGTGDMDEEVLALVRDALERARSSEGPAGGHAAEPSGDNPTGPAGDNAAGPAGGNAAASIGADLTGAAAGEPTTGADQPAERLSSDVARAGRSDVAERRTPTDAGS